jgi:lysophospholipase L1-like esterase
MPTRRVLRLLLLIELVVVALIARQWAYVTTYRLFVDRAAGALQSAATQQFGIVGSRVVPRIVTQKPERLTFASPLKEPLTFRADIQATRTPVRYAVTWRDATTQQVLETGVVTNRVSISRAPRSIGGVVELEADGPAAWIDARFVRGMRVRRHLAVLLLLTAVSAFVNRRGSPRDRRDVRATGFKAIVLIGTVVAATCACELVLRAMGGRGPAGVLAQRRDLGEVWPDDRWDDSPTYGRRLRAGVDTENAWQYGDIVRMGFIAPAVSPGVPHRFRFETDAEGFRNAAVRARVDIAALGDSFTDGLTVAADLTWPSRLQQRLGVAVQNYGTAGFGPQQELLVLREYVIPRRPSTVVLAYFAGNDIFDAERFDRFAHGHIESQSLGWQIKDVYSRADTWYVTSALSAGAGWFARGERPFVVSASAATPASDPPIQAAAPFDRGLFTLNVDGHVLQWAFMPPYLDMMNFSERELRGRAGWRLTRDAVLAMDRESRAAGATFVVMFLPFKSQVHWPLLERSLTPDDLRTALDFYLKDNGRPIDAAVLRRNRLAQNTMMRDLCESNGIPLLDTTPVLQQRVESGENVYFPDDSHLNETGLAVVADALARFLQER